MQAEGQFFYPAPLPSYFSWLHVICDVGLDEEEY